MHFPWSVREPYQHDTVPVTLKPAAVTEWKSPSAAKQLEKVRTEQESNTPGAKAHRILIVYGPTKVVP
jgi:hypothetical protein